MLHALLVLGAAALFEVGSPPAVALFEVGSPPAATRSGQPRFAAAHFERPQDGGAVAGDAAGRVYLAGRAPGNRGDYLVHRYSPFGRLDWSRTYDGPAGGADSAAAIAVDRFGGIVVTGSSDGGAATGADFCTIRYDRAGTLCWVARFDGAAWPDAEAEGTTGIPPWGGARASRDVAAGVAVDDSANVYVTGWCTGPEGGAQIRTIKYSRGGRELWTHGYAAAGGGHGLRIVRDARSGLVVVTGAGGAGSPEDGARGGGRIRLTYSCGGALLSATREVAHEGAESGWAGGGGGPPARRPAVDPRPRGDPDRDRVPRAGGGPQS